MRVIDNLSSFCVTPDLSTFLVTSEKCENVGSCEKEESGCRKLVCGEHVAVFKEYNLKRHYETKHAKKYKNWTDAERARTPTDLLAKLEKQQGCFTKLHAARDAATRTSFVIANKTILGVHGRVCSTAMPREKRNV